MRCASNGKVWMKMLANGNRGSILAQGTAVFIYWLFYSSVWVLRLLLGLEMAESSCAGPFSMMTWGQGPEQPFVLQGVIRGSLMKWKEQGGLSFYSRKCNGRRNSPTALVVSESQKHPGALGEGTDTTQCQESAQERQSSMWPGEPTYRQQTGEKFRHILSSEKALIPFLVWWGGACANIHQDE